MPCSNLATCSAAVKTKCSTQCSAHSPQPVIDKLVWRIHMGRAIKRHLGAWRGYDSGFMIQASPTLNGTTGKNQEISAPLVHIPIMFILKAVIFGNCIDFFSHFLAPHLNPLLSFLYLVITHAVQVGRIHFVSQVFVSHTKLHWH